MILAVIIQVYFKKNMKDDAVEEEPVVEEGTRSK